ncbi:hypothetical protein CIL05_06200 [Virgibacillus profundi]|uniref:PepSY domain-containing protein n=1 Tax=Virgibacillus profundi TaxID=2024555 RepID=A0A2A2IHT0_9BACI|nr:PepSY domain-containing protein [Virgibacillus profundi]PAV30690.1 hypothetical protein CIL05_06200 [Virgibacillus profundi]PXY54862.1 hypothetical protein CIT14_06285 [Virgibacillus profundi]
MKKKLGLTIGTLAAAAVLGLGFSQSGAVQAEPDLTTDDIRNKVTAQYPGEIKELELEGDSKNAIYGVEIKIEDKEYKLKLDGNTGEVLSLDENVKAMSQKENNDKKAINKLSFNERILTADDAVETGVKDDDKSNKQDKKQEGKVEKPAKSNEKSVKEKSESNNKLVIAEKPSSNNNDDADDRDDKVEKADKLSNKTKVVKTDKPAKKEKPAKKAVISKSKAKSIALNQFSGNIEEIELDRDDGRLIYEVEIKNGNKEAEIEIDAYTGKVILVDIDTDDDDDDD